MPKYAKFLKGLLTNKARLEEACTITMNERCSTVLLKLHINNALADLGATIRLMPYTMYGKLGLGEPKATRMSLELVDRPPTEDDECYGVDDLDDPSRMLRRPRYVFFTLIYLGKLVSKNGYGVLEGYTEEIVHDFEQMLETIFERHVNRVHTLKFEGLTLDMRQDLAERLSMVYTWDDGQEIFAPEKVTATNLLYLRSIDRGIANVSYLLAQYLFRHTEGRKSGARLSRGHFIGRLARHFGLVSDDRLRGLSVMTRKLSLIDIGELVKLSICIEIGDDWAWVALIPERQPDATVGAPRAAKDSPTVDGGAQADPAPVQAPQPSPPPPTAGSTMP
nr:hypothetical protein [Tanacetum cinerariifolium]